MKPLADYIKRFTIEVIVAGKPVGSGVALLPGDHSRYFYVLTARHCVFGNDFSNERPKEAVMLQHPAADGHRFGIRDWVLPVSRTMDALVLVCDMGDWHLPPEVLPVAAPRPRQRQGDYSFLQEYDLLFRGFPRASVKEGRGRALSIEGQFVEHDGDVTFTVKTENLDTFEASARTAVKGFSGSGIFLRLHREHCLLGLVKSFPRGFNRHFDAVLLTQVNHWLKRKQLPPLAMRRISPYAQSEAHFRDVVMTLEGRLKLFAQAAVPLSSDKYNAWIRNSETFTEAIGYYSLLCKDDSCGPNYRTYIAMIARAKLAGKEAVDALFQAHENDIQLIFSNPAFVRIIANNIRTEQDLSTFLHRNQQVILAQPDKTLRRICHRLLRLKSAPLVLPMLGECLLAIRSRDFEYHYLAHRYDVRLGNWDDAERHAHNMKRYTSDAEEQALFNFAVAERILFQECEADYREAVRRCRQALDVLNWRQNPEIIHTLLWLRIQLFRPKTIPRILLHDKKKYGFGKNTLKRVYNAVQRGKRKDALSALISGWSNITGEGEEG